MGREYFQPFWRNKDNGPDRPEPGLVHVGNAAARLVVGSHVEAPLTQVRTTRRGQVIGGGMSPEAKRRARRRAAANGSS
jgi:hypothetical protein